jgi:transglutaminase-like putative cysteine protease
MTSLTIRHVTTYRYRQPVSFGEHRLMLRPREQHDQKIIEASLGITPVPSSLRFVEDSFGNHVAIACFTGQATELSFESIVSLEHLPADTSAIELEDHARTYPVDYTGIEAPDLADCLQRRYPDPENEIGRWAGQFLEKDGPIVTLDLLARLSRGIQQAFVYRRREAKGIQSPLETMQLGQGTCRDFALLMIEAARALGFAARFASGYLASPSEELAEPEAKKTVSSASEEGPHGATHAWAQVYLPGAGWVDFDPTCGSVGKSALVTVAVVHDPNDALPLHGTFIGGPSDPLGMDVHVSVTSGSA